MVQRIAVLGAGYAGLTAATRLVKRLSPKAAQITLVNASPQFVERPRLHQLAAGRRVPSRPLADFFNGEGTSLVIDRVTGIDLAARKVRLNSEPKIAYDSLVYALGSNVDVSAVPGVAEHAHVLDTPESALRFHDLIAQRARRRGGVVAVCGGGLTGIEAATEVAEAFPTLDVHLVSRTEPGVWMRDRARRHLRKVFDRLGVTVHSGAAISAVEREVLRLDGGRSLSFDVCLWAGGFGVPTLARQAGLEVRPNGRAVVDETLRSVSHPEVSVIGDAAAACGAWGAELAYGCRTGGTLGPYVADAIADRLAERSPKPFRFRYVHECVSLGRRDALIQFMHADETPGRVLTGRLAVRYKETVLGSVMWLFAHPGPYLRRDRLTTEGGR
ncbi:NAD(P)/FAD-dependent oxidoreductase [Actinopolymorpha alba]|uniref:NAD(P)/FAD-dependent oxidoreductase n=1 Tax=Actinopolymorpha alba TaxID=533267 RepID=UPI00036B71BD|nr:FAD-dependent oxidoreductase [Actinopolymorpha alba]